MVVYTDNCPLHERVKGQQDDANGKSRARRLRRLGSFIQPLGVGRVADRDGIRPTGTLG